MTKRSEDWNEELARQLKDPEVAREFILALTEEGRSLREALAYTVRSYGVTEFAEAVDLPISNVSRALKEDYKPGHKLLTQMLSVFDLELATKPVRKGLKKATKSIPPSHEKMSA